MLYFGGRSVFGLVFGTETAHFAVGRYFSMGGQCGRSGTKWDVVDLVGQCEHKTHFYWVQLDTHSTTSTAWRFFYLTWLLTENNTTSLCLYFFSGRSDLGPVFSTISCYFPWFFSKKQTLPKHAKKTLWIWVMGPVTVDSQQKQKDKIGTKLTHESGIPYPPDNRYIYIFLLNCLITSINSIKEHL